MKKLLITASILLLTVNLNAQVGMPRELTCTEEAFTFSASLGSGWKFTTPKMGPVETIENNPYIILSWSLKTKDETLLLHGTFPNAHDLNQQKDVQSIYLNKLKFLHGLNHTITPSYFSRPINYNLIDPGFLMNRNPYPTAVPFPLGMTSDNFLRTSILQ